VERPETPSIATIFAISVRMCRGWMEVAPSFRAAVDARTQRPRTQSTCSSTFALRAASVSGVPMRKSSNRFAEEWHLASRWDSSASMADNRGSDDSRGSPLAMVSLPLLDPASASRAPAFASVEPTRRTAIANANEIRLSSPGICMFSKETF
jgi:hypothetical protein